MSNKFQCRLTDVCLLQSCEKWKNSPANVPQLPKNGPLLRLKQNVAQFSRPLPITVNLADRNTCGRAIFFSDLQLDEYHPNFISNEFLSSKPRHAISSFINEILVSLSLSLSLSHSPTLPLCLSGSPRKTLTLDFPTPRLRRDKASRKLCCSVCRMKQHHVSVAFCIIDGSSPHNKEEN